MERSNYHDSKTGKFVSEEYAKANPETTTEVTATYLRKELEEFFDWMEDNDDGQSRDILIDKYLDGKER